MDEQIKQKIGMINRGRVPKRYKKTKIGIVPSHWSTIELGDHIYDMKSGLSRKLSNIDIGIPVLRSNNIFNHKVIFDDLRYWYSNDPQGANVSNYYLEDGDLLVNFINSMKQIGKTAIFVNTINRKVICTTNILKVSLLESLDFRYFFYFTQTKRYQDYIYSISKPAVNQASFTTKDFKQIKLNVPSTSEQKKIVEILSTWDQAINLKTDLIIQKKEQKKGLMQNLLTGKIRWNDSDIYSENKTKRRVELINQGKVPDGYRKTKIGILPNDWSMRKLSDISTKVKRTSQSNNYHILTISSLSGFLAQSQRFSKVIAGKNISKYILLNHNEFAYNKGNSKTYPFGCIFRLEEYREALVPNVYYCFNLKVGVGDFYKHYFFSGHLNRQLAKIINTGVRNDGLLNLSIQDFFSSIIIAPPLLEQQKIADILTIADKEIELLKQELDALKQQKKGLMQLLLTGIMQVDQPQSAII